MQKLQITTDVQTLHDRLFAQDRRLIEAAQRVATIVQSIAPDSACANAQPRALIIGGFVRDSILGLRPKDIDLEVYGVSPPRLEQVLHQLYQGLVHTVGRAFGILKIHLGEDVEFDISIPRRDSKTGPGHRGIAVTSDPCMTVQEAAQRRDFTINAIAADPLTGEIFDPYNGLTDLRERCLRVVDEERFQDDPLRVYRALQLAARMELTTDPMSLELMRGMVARGDTQELTQERVTEEVKKMLLRAEKPSIGFELARTLGLIEKEMPELHALINTPQEPEWHPEGDVWIHTMLVIDQAATIIRQPHRSFTPEEELEVMLGALCHDLGKPATTRVIDGRIRSLDHEAQGGDVARSFCKRFAFSERVVESVIAIVKDHLKPAIYFLDQERKKLTEQQYANATRRLLKRIAPTHWRVLCAAAEADARGRAIPGYDQLPYTVGDFMASIIEKYALDKAPTEPLIRGRDLIALGVLPGPEMGNLIHRIEGLRDEGKIQTHKEAMDIVREFIQRPSK